MQHNINKFWKLTARNTKQFRVLNKHNFAISDGYMYVELPNRIVPEHTKTAIVVTKTIISLETGLFENFWLVDRGLLNMWAISGILE
jgi:hypothetical protein